MFRKIFFVLWFLESPYKEMYVHCVVERDQDNSAKERFE